MKDELENELQKEIKRTARWGRRNFVFAHIVFFTAIISSFVASIMIMGNDINSRIWLYITAGISALSGTVLTIGSTFRFDERARWFWNKNRLLQSYYRRLRYDENCDVVALTNEYSQKMEEMEKEWPGFGNIKQ